MNQMMEEAQKKRALQRCVYEADNVPVKASTKRLESELNGKTLTVKVYPDTGHSLMDETLRREGQHILVQGLLDDLDAWIESNL